MTIKVECAWGAGIDVVVAIEEHAVLLMEKPSLLDKLKHGLVRNSQFDLTATEALNLAGQLRTAALNAQEQDKMAADHDKHMG